MAHQLSLKFKKILSLVMMGVWGGGEGGQKHYLLKPSRPRLFKNLRPIGTVLDRVSLLSVAREALNT